MLKNMSITRLIALSQAPPRYPAVSPSAPPSAMATPIDVTATYREIREP